MILGSYIFKYPKFHKVELYCENFPSSFAHDLYSKGWKYQRYSKGIFYQIFNKGFQISSEKYLKVLSFIRINKIPMKVVDLTIGVKK